MGGQLNLDGDHDLDIELTSALLTGVYGMWNIYIISLLILYAPSHKKWLQKNLGLGYAEHVLHRAEDQTGIKDRNGQAIQLNPHFDCV